MVSNHGGRQVDGAIASLDALPPIVEAVAPAASCSTPGSVPAGDASRRSRWAADAVLIGRPYLYGLALEGQAGVTQVMRRLVADLERTVAGSGHRSHRELSRASLSRAR